MHVNDTQLTLVVDHDHSGLSRTLIKDISATEGVRLAGVVGDFGEAKTMLERRQVDAIVLIPADLERGLLNMRSPLARALIGKDEGDSVEVVTPGGGKSYEIISIRYV